MKKLLVLTAVLLLSVAPAMAGNYVKGTIGYFSPTENNLDSALILNVAAGMDLKKQLGAPISVELGLGITDPETNNVDVTIVPLTLTGLVELPLNIPNMAFNVGAGVGIYFWEVDGPGNFLDDDGSDLGIHVQAGAELALNKQVSLVGELKWAKVDIEDGDGGGTSLNVGGKFNF